MQRRSGVLGAELLRLAAEDAAHRGLRLFGMDGVPTTIVAMSVLEHSSVFPPNASS